MRIVSLLPSLTEVCFALGLGEQVVAVTHECDYPPAARQKPHATRNVLPPGIDASAEIDRLVGERVAAGLPIYELDADLLERLKPDLILTQELCEVCAVSYQDVLAVARQLSSRPEVASIEPHGVDDVLASISTVGRLTDRQASAEAVVEALRHRVERVRGKVTALGDAPRRAVCLEWLDPPMAGGHWVPEMVELAGGHDPIGRARRPSFYVEWEQVIAADPEVLVLMPCGFDLERSVAEAALLRAVPGLARTRAVRNGKVYAVDGSGYFNRPGPRLVAGIEILAGILHPEAFGGINVADRAQLVQIDNEEPRR